MTTQTLKDFLAAGRVANLPSVVSNVLLGCGLGLFAGGSSIGSLVFWLPCLVGCLLYLGGCFFNDWHDRAWDAENRPERAIPAGRISSRLMGGVAIALMLIGLGLSILLEWQATLVAVGILFFITIYTLIHKRTSWGVLPMGVCRSLLYPLGFFSQLGAGQEALLLPVVLGLLAYVAGLSLFARAESQPVVPQLNRVLGIALLFLVVLTHSFSWLSHGPLWSLISLIPFLALLTLGIVRMRQSVPRGVSVLLANICLVDFIVALPLAVALLNQAGSPQAFLFPVASFSAFLFALLLQKITPAT